jgi:hypothetical protein
MPEGSSGEQIGDAGLDGDVGIVAFTLGQCDSGNHGGHDEYTGLGVAQ